MNTEKQDVDFDLMQLVAEATASGSFKPIKLGKVKNSGKSKKLDLKLVETAPKVVISQAVPVAVVDYFLKVKCSCGAEHEFLQQTRVKLEHPVRAGSRWEFVRMDAAIIENLNLPGESFTSEILVEVCEKCKSEFEENDDSEDAQ